MARRGRLSLKRNSLLCARSAASGFAQVPTGATRCRRGPRRVERALDVPPSECGRLSQLDSAGLIVSDTFAAECSQAQRVGVEPARCPRRAGYTHTLRSPWQVLVLLPLFFLLLFLHLLLLALFLVFLTALVSHRPAPCSPLWLVTASASQTRVSLGGMTGYFANHERVLCQN